MVCKAEKLAAKSVELSRSWRRPALKLTDHAQATQARHRLHAEPGSVSARAGIHQPSSQKRNRADARGHEPNLRHDRCAIVILDR